VVRDVSRRPTLRELRIDVYRELDDQWTSPTEIRQRLGLGAGIDHYRVCLILERFANDGHAEIRAKPGSSVRKFSRRQA
jgi:hypothetical protein